MRGIVLHPIVLGVGLLLATFSAVLTGQSGVAVASLIATGPVQEKESQDAQVSETLDRGLLTAKLVELGLSEQEASGKVAQLDHEGVAALVETLASLRAGGQESEEAPDILSASSYMICTEDWGERVAVAVFPLAGC